MNDETTRKILSITVDQRGHILRLKEITVTIFTLAERRGAGVLRAPRQILPKNMRQKRSSRRPQAFEVPESQANLYNKPIVVTPNQEWVDPDLMLPCPGCSVMVKAPRLAAHVKRLHPRIKVDAIGLSAPTAPAPPPTQRSRSTMTITTDRHGYFRCLFCAHVISRKGLLQHHIDDKHPTFRGITLLFP